MVDDKLETIGDTLLQHGPVSDRVYLMQLGESADPANVVETVDKLANRHGYGKIFAKVPADEAEPFLEAGYLLEAKVPGLFGGRKAGYFLGKFLRRSRQLVSYAPVSKALRLARQRKATPVDPLAKGFELREATPGDAPALSAIYRQVFETYPFPISDPDYLCEIMDTHVDFFCICHEEQPVAVASMEKDVDHGCAEMTDFATLPAFRRRGFAAHLLQHMARIGPGRGIRTAYTIARAVSAGINITFARCGYRYAGTLVNNTCISGNIETMNVWYRPLSATAVNREACG